MRRKAVGPVCCVMHVKEPKTLIVKEQGLAPVFLDSRLEHPAGWICARYKSSALLFCIIIISMCIITQRMLWNSHHRKPVMRCKYRRATLLVIAYHRHIYTTIHFSKGASFPKTDTSETTVKHRPQYS